MRGGVDDTESVEMDGEGSRILARLKTKLLHECRGIFFAICRLLSLVFTVVLLALLGTYINALVMDRTIGSFPIPIVLLVLFSVSLLYIMISFAFYIGHSKAGARFIIMATLDFLLFVVYMLATVKLGLEVTAMSCGKKQFTTTHLNRYGMNYFDSTHTLRGWAKSSYNHCQSAKAIFVMCIMLAILFIITSIINMAIWWEKHRKGGRHEG